MQITKVIRWIMERGIEAGDVKWDLGRVTPRFHFKLKQFEVKQTAGSYCESFLHSNVQKVGVHNHTLTFKEF